MGETKQASRIELADGRIFFDVTVILELNYVLVNVPDKGGDSVDQVDSAFSWHMVKEIVFKHG